MFPLFAALGSIGQGIGSAASSVGGAVGSMGQNVLGGLGSMGLDNPIGLLTKTAKSAIPGNQSLLSKGQFGGYIGDLIKDPRFWESISAMSKEQTPTQKRIQEQPYA